MDLLVVLESLAKETQYILYYRVQVDKHIGVTPQYPPRGHSDQQEV